MGVSRAIPSKGHYGVAKDIMYSFPLTVKDGVISVVEGFDCNTSIKECMKAMETKLLDEKEAVEHLL